MEKRLKKKRWGKEFKDNRNWKEYNEKLVRRGEIYLSLEFIKNWDTEIDKMNNNKRGRPYEFPFQFILFMAFVHSIFYMPYRQMEGFVRQLSKFVSPLKAADYTTMFKRIAKLDIPVKDTVTEKSDNMIIAVDSTGVKVTNRGEWMREKWKIHRGWIKVHIAVDIKTKEIVGIEVTDESVSDHEKFGDLIESAKDCAGKEKIYRVLGDGGYDTKDIFNQLDDEGIESCIKTRGDASTKARGSPYRAKCVRERKRLGYEKWKEKYEYGQRWASEGTFSAVKRIFGECVRASTVKGMFQEVKMKFIFYNMLLNIA